MSPEPAPNLLVFDSGMGGISVARAIRARIPAARLLYVADNAAFPYGALDDATLVARVLAAVAAALDVIVACDAIVVACNTASTLVLEPLRALYRIPIVGVVPPVKWAAAISETREIGVLATAATARRPYLGDLVTRFAGPCRVTIHGAPRLAAYAERDFGGETIADRLIQDEVAPLFAHAPAIDTVALGCTHYPLLLGRLNFLFPGRRFLDPAAAVAARTAAVAVAQGPWRGTLPANRTLCTAAPSQQAARLRDEGLPFAGLLG